VPGGGASIPLVDDEATHEVRIVLGQAAAVRAPA
jgi:hypothetical protein